MSDWIILRTAGRSTLNLAKSLGEDGFDVWTPIENRTIRVPRKNVRRPITLPLMPSYVFAKAGHLIDLLEMACLDFKPRRAAGQPAHAGFTVMHYHDRIPVIGEGQLHSLRRLEHKLKPKVKADHSFGKGVQVRVKIEGGSFAGMKGVVRKSDSGHTLVCFDDRLEVKIDTLLLEENQLRKMEPCLDDFIRRAA